MTTRVLEQGRRPAASGQGKSVVVFLHGYGADGADLLGLADPLAPHLPDTVFVAPDAPEVCVNNPMGFQWFPIPWLDGSSTEAAEAGIASAAADLDAYLDTVLAEEGLSPEQMVVVGFSQGTMLALHTVPRRAAPVAGIVGFSGRLVQPELLEEARSKPPVLLVHGDQDEVVPPQSLPDAANALTAAGFEVYAHVSKGMAHGIAPDGLSVALAFIRNRLGLEEDVPA
ncbi:phospholipase [Brevirhabdus pacifica]|uniref:Phospholipase n=1 Tax=Brevirhabdus pacifica TaxID=1267768 RepID=A0A1U7DF51_9RHOB|nr:alpha/beta fold hydrolase [Brevirhabdus pacifica]APX88508.1 phospholipase [Brevirhabdus pacifica]OWU79808.1 phospholipase [Loktanella sp. 22II-4b]PJJ87012.1 phospholipase/carboxylesterase [Brevirhabdus pacifica]